MNTTLQQQARALGDPTRHAIFRYLAEAPAPLGVAELTEHFGFNHNAIRQHLAKLLEAHLVEEGKAAGKGRGRPRLTYRVAAAVDSRWSVVGPYERLSVLLAEIVRTGDTPVEIGRRSAHRLRLGATPTEGDPIDVVAEAMARHGFEPFIGADDGDEVEMVLGSCPFETAALADPDIVCAIHLGIAQGVAEVTGGRVEVEDLVPQDPRRANCLLHLRVTAQGRGEASVSGA